MIHRLIIGAPFGNYLSFPRATSTLGTFTTAYRGGFWYRAWRVLRTVRYYHGIRAWKNQLGLPNPSLCWLEKKCRDCNPSAASRSNSSSDSPTCGKIISVRGCDRGDWVSLVDRARLLLPAAVECNVSCPNAGPGMTNDQTQYTLLFNSIGVASGHGAPLIVKLPPVGYEPIVEGALCAGVKNFHCCNTLPTPGGGLSGKPLKPLSLHAVEWVRRRAAGGGHALDMVVGGGGVTSIQDARDYLAAGATHVSVASVLFFPWRWRTVQKIAQLLQPGAPG